MRGGYLIIDLKNKNFGEESAYVYPGIYEQIENTRKPIHICNVVFGSTEIKDCAPAICVPDGTDFVMEAGTNEGTLIFRVMDTDVVKITNL